MAEGGEDDGQQVIFPMAVEESVWMIISLSKSTDGGLHVWNSVSQIMHLNKFGSSTFQNLHSDYTQSLQHIQIPFGVYRPTAH